MSMARKPQQHVLLTHYISKKGPVRQISWRLVAAIARGCPCSHTMTAQTVWKTLTGLLSPQQDVQQVRTCSDWNKPQPDAHGEYDHPTAATPAQQELLSRQMLLQQPLLLLLDKLVELYKLLE
jgi:hypothetical protein